MPGSGASRQGRDRPESSYERWPAGYTSARRHIDERIWRRAVCRASCSAVAISQGRYGPSPTSAQDDRPLALGPKARAAPGLGSSSGHASRCRCWVVLFVVFGLLGVTYFTNGDVVAKRDWFG